MSTDDKPPETSAPYDDLIVEYVSGSRERLTDAIRDPDRFQRNCAFWQTAPIWDGMLLGPSWLSLPRLARLWNLDPAQVLDLAPNILVQYEYDGQFIAASGSPEPVSRTIFRVSDVFSAQCHSFDKIWEKMGNGRARSKFVKDYAGGILRHAADESPVVHDDGTKVKPDKLTAGKRDRNTARAYAQGRWAEDPVITIQSMSSDIWKTIRFESETGYKQRTIYDWIKDLAPNRAPGRRAKKS